MFIYFLSVKQIPITELLLVDLKMRGRRLSIQVTTFMSSEHPLRTSCLKTVQRVMSCNPIGNGPCQPCNLFSHYIFGRYL